MVLQETFFNIEKCKNFGKQFMKYEMNKYFTFKVQCIEDVGKNT